RNAPMPPFRGSRGSGSGGRRGRMATPPFFFLALNHLFHIKHPADKGDTMSDLEYSVKDHIATILLNRPEKLNAFNPAMLKAWQESLRSAQADPEVRVVVLTGAGRAFCSGGDTGRMAERAADKETPDSPISAKESLRAGPQGVALAVQALEKPLIAAVNGVAAGAGMDMALMCDIRLAAKSARFSEAYMRVGLM